MSHSEYIENLILLYNNALEDDKGIASNVIRIKLEHLGYEQDDDGVWVKEDETSHAV